MKSLALVEAPVPTPSKKDLLIRVAATSVNYRDKWIGEGGILPDLVMPFVPVSDMVGEVVAVGVDVSWFKVGDRVPGKLLDARGLPARVSAAQRFFRGKIAQPNFERTNEFIDAEIFSGLARERDRFRFIDLEQDTWLGF